jgi:dUTP pyrophosphatase
MPHGRIIIPTGIRFDIPEGTYLEVANRGSTAALKGLIYGAHIIDSDYVGIVFINLINTTESTTYLKPGEKLVQLIHKEYIHSDLVCIEEKSLLKKVTTRGDGSLGSTDKGVSQ